MEDDDYRDWELDSIQDIVGACADHLGWSGKDIRYLRWDSGFDGLGKEKGRFLISLKRCSG